MNGSRTTDPSDESPCSCPENSWGAIKCEERSGPWYTYCRWERYCETHCSVHGRTLPCPVCIEIDREVDSYGPSA